MLPYPHKVQTSKTLQETREVKLLTTATNLSSEKMSIFFFLFFPLLSFGLQTRQFSRKIKEMEKTQCDSYICNNMFYLK